MQGLASRAKLQDFEFRDLVVLGLGSLIGGGLWGAQLS